MMSVGAASAGNFTMTVGSVVGSGFGETYTGWGDPLTFYPALGNIGSANPQQPKLKGVTICELAYQRASGSPPTTTVFFACKWPAGQNPNLQKTDLISVTLNGRTWLGASANVFNQGTGEFGGFNYTVWQWSNQPLPNITVGQQYPVEVVQ